ncbi:MAG TPA: (Fe-S)-binding protein [Gaiellales bacterium]|nr:(Fe-S)-binding protein [Gaiellales bacterium]
MTETTRELLDACVHCGFCLPACPTYALWGEEMDSPRGRIHLMNLVETGEAAMDGSVATHLDRCLGCLACVPACPSGVRYDLLIERARAERRREAPRGLRARVVDAAVFAVVPRPRLLRALSWPLALGLRPSALAPRVSAADLRAAPPPFTAAAGGEPRMRVALLSGCAQRVFFGRVNAAAVRALAAAGCEVHVPAGQGCCGALHLHAGRERDAKRRAAQAVESLSGYDRVVVTAAGCGSAMKGYGELLGTPEAEAFAARVCDVTELLADLAPEQAEPVSARPLRVVYQDACHLRHGQGVVDEPRTVLGSVPGVELVEIADAGMCCGSAGTYNLMQPAAARELGERKARAILEAEPDLIATANPGCALQLAASLRRLGRDDLRIVHPVELLVSAPG